MMSCPTFARTIGRALLKALPQEAETSRSSQSGSRGRPAPRRRERGSGRPANPLIPQSSIDNTELSIMSPPPAEVSQGAAFDRPLGPR